MSLLVNLKTDWTLSMDSLAVLRDHLTLLAYPVISVVATALFAVFLYLGVFVADLVGAASSTSRCSSSIS